MACVLANPLSKVLIGRYLSQIPLSEVLGFALPTPFDQMTLVSLEVAAVILTSSHMMILGLYNALTKKNKNSTLKKLWGLMPVVLINVDLYLVYTYSEWAWHNTGYVILMLTPVISLINCRQIVCNVTD